MSRRPRVAVVLLTGLVVGCVLVSVPSRLPFPVRVRGPELRTLVFCYALAALGLGLHVRRRDARLMEPAAWLFVLAFLARLLCLLALPSISLRMDSTRYGYGTPDSVSSSLVVRAMVFSVDKIDRHGLQNDIRNLREDEYGWRRGAQLSAKTSEAAQTATMSTYYGLQFVLVKLLGYSVVAYCLPFAVLGAFWVAQAYVLLRRWWRPAPALGIALLMAVGTDFIFESVVISKEPACGMAWLFVCESVLLLEQRGGKQFWRGLWRMLPAVVWGGIFRSALVGLSFLAYGGTALYYRLRPSRRRQVMLVGFVLLMLFVWRRQQHNSYGPAGVLPFALWAQLLVVPPPSFVVGREMSTTVLGYLPVALVWPLCAGLLVVTAAMLFQRRLSPSPGLSMVIVLYLIAVSADYPMTLQAARWRLVVWPLIAILVCDAVRLMQAAPPAQRQRLARLAGSVATAVYALDVLLLLKG
jgi:hypothetical protein